MMFKTFTPFFTMLFFLLFNRGVTESVAVTYSSTVSIVHHATKCHLFTTKITWSNGNQAITCSKEVEAENYFYIREGDSPYKGAGYSVICGEIIRLLHSATEKFIESNKSSKSMISRQIEVFGGSGGDTSLFKVECEKKSQGQKLNIGEKFKLLNIATNGYLSASKKFVFDNRNCPRCPILGQFEVSITKKNNDDNYWHFNNIMMIEHSSKEESRDEL